VKKPGAAAKASPATAGGQNSARSSVPPTAAKKSDAPRPQKVTAESKKGTSSVVFLSVLLLAAIVAVSVMTYPRWSGHFDQFVSGLTEKKPAPKLVATKKPALEEVKPDTDLVIQKLEKERERMSLEMQTLITRINQLEKTVDEVQGMARTTAAASDSANSGDILNTFSDRMKQLESGQENMDQILKRLGVLESTQSEPKALRSNIETLEQITAKQNEALSQAVSQFDQRLGNLEKSSGTAMTNNNGAAALILAIANLREKIRSGLPYAADLEAVKGLAQKDPEVALADSVLRDFAGQGIPPLALLRDEFDTAASKIIMAASAGDESGWASRAVNEISSLVRVRRVGDGLGLSSVEGIVATAEQRLSRNNLGGAVEALDLLGGETSSSGRAAVDWLNRAKARLIAEKTIAALGSYAVAKLSPGEG